MQILWLILCGLAGGVLAGMGMGGGTVLIPLLTIFLGLSQRLSQGINLIVFLPMSLIVIFIYAKKKLINFKVWWLISLPATLVCVFGAFFAIKMPAKVLKIVFGCFIIVVAAIQLVALIVSLIKSKKKT